MFRKGTKLTEVLSNFDMTADIDVYVENMGFIVGSRKTYGFVDRMVADSSLCYYVVDHESVGPCGDVSIIFTSDVDVDCSELPVVVSLNLSNIASFSVFER